MAAYTRDLRAYPPLTGVAEDQVCASIRSGNERARYALVLGSLRLVCTWAKRASRGNLDHLEDLIGVGNLTLLGSARDYDVDSGFRFGAFLYWRLRKAFSTYYASVYGLSLTTHHRYRQQSRPLPESTTLDDPEEQPVELVASNDPESAAIQRQSALIVAMLGERLREQLDQLPRREHDIVRATGAVAGDPVTNADLCREHSISRAWVKRLRKRALKQLRTALLEAVCELRG